MNTHTTSIYDRVEQYFTGPRFPSFILFTLLLFWLLMITLAFMPAGESQWGMFVEDFKRWCFGYEPESGNINWMYVITFTIQPMMIALVVWFVWKDPLAEAFKNPRKIRPQAFQSVAVVLLAGLAFPLLYNPPDEPDYQFRAEEMRRSVDPPSFTLINHKEEEIGLDSFEDKVIILTSVYATCGDTCPMILDQARDAIDLLEDHEREQVVLLAITMDPEHDTPELLNRTAGFYRLDEYNGHLLTGDPEVINPLLDRLSVERRRNEQTGEIEHVNLFHLIDGDGTMAYRFALGENQAEWMAEGMRVLIRELDTPKAYSANE